MSSDDNDEAAEGAAVRKRGKEQPRRAVSNCGLALATTIIQTVCGASGEDYGLLNGLLHKERARNLRWNSNAGDVLELLVASLGLDFSPVGKQLWRRGDPDQKLTWRPPAADNSRKPAPARATTLGVLATLNLEHDKETWASGVGRRADRDAADAGRPTMTRSLARIAPDAIDKFTTRLGTGWGHRPKPRAARCVAEVGQLEELVMGVQEHAACCGPFTELIDAIILKGNMRLCVP